MGYEEQNQNPSGEKILILLSVLFHPLTANFKEIAENIVRG